MNPQPAKQIGLPGIPIPDKLETLAGKFGVPPFSVLDARQGYWQDRKRDWLSLGIKSECGRGDDAGMGQGNYSRVANNPGSKGDTRTGMWKHFKDEKLAANTLSSVKGMSYAGGYENSPAGTSGTSIFDPVLCELVYRWFGFPRAKVLDPFAGGSVRGIVAAVLGLDYNGIELSPRQIEANKRQAAEILLTGENGYAGKPNIGRIQWLEGDSTNAATIAPGRYDLIFSCPPYGNLEVYSDDPRDISTMEKADFDEAYRAIIRASVSMLKDNRFACFVVGDYRDKEGFYNNFISQTILAFEDAGMGLYNEAILVTSVGNLPIRVGQQFGKYRKIGKTHQNVLVFYKGNPQAIKNEFPAIEAGFYE